MEAQSPRGLRFLHFSECVSSKSIQSPLCLTVIRRESRDD
jgi:hypothetical protein